MGNDICVGKTTLDVSFQCGTLADHLWTAPAEPAELSLLG